MSLSKDVCDKIIKYCARPLHLWKKWESWSIPPTTSYRESRLIWHVDRLSELDDCKTAKLSWSFQPWFSAWSSVKECGAAFSLWVGKMFIGQSEINEKTGTSSGFFIFKMPKQTEEQMKEICLCIKPYGVFNLKLLNLCMEIEFI